MGKIMLNDIDYSSTNVGGGSSVDIDVSSFMGKNTNFVTSYQNGGNVNDFKTEYHGFVFNMSNTPEIFGFLDVTKFDGTGFNQSPQGVIRQTFTTWNNGVQYVRCYSQNAWSSWISSVNKNGDTMNGNLTIDAGATEAQVNIKNNFAEGKLISSTAGNLGVYDVKHGYWIVRGDSEQNVSIGQANHAILDGRTGRGIPLFRPLNLNYSELTGAKSHTFTEVNGYFYQTAILFFKYVTSASDAYYIEGSLTYNNIAKSGNAENKHVNNLGTYISVSFHYSEKYDYYVMNLFNTNGIFNLNGVLFC